MDTWNESADGPGPAEETPTQEEFFANIGHKLATLEKQVNDKRAAVLRAAVIHKKMPEGMAMDKLQNQLLAFEIAELKILIFTTLVQGEDSERIQQFYHFSLFSKYLAWLKETETELLRSAFTDVPRLKGL